MSFTVLHAVERKNRIVCKPLAHHYTEGMLIRFHEGTTASVIAHLCCGKFKVEMSGPWPPNLKGTKFEIV